jgi:flagellar biosynthetic protein FliR
MELYLEHLSTLGLVLTRIAALVMVAPLFGPFAVPLKMRAAVAVALAVLVAPLEVARETAAPATLLTFATAAAGEALVGLMLGLGVRILFASLQVAGQAISQIAGLQLAEVFSPGAGGNVPVFSQLLACVAAAVFVTIGGHRLVVEALLDTFAWLPVGQGGFSQSALDAVTVLVAQSFVLGVRAAAPALVALLLATLIVGLVSRTLPQLNLMALGFGFQAVVALVAIGISLGGACFVFQEELPGFVETTLQALKPR